MGLLPVVAGVVDERLVKEARSDFDKVHQKFDESIEDFIARYKANVDILRRVAAVVLTEKSKAYEFMTKLNRSLYGEKLTAMAEEESTQLRYLTNNPGQPRLIVRGYPQTFAEATMQARQWEISAAAKIHKGTQRREKKAEQESVAEAGVSYTKVESGKSRAAGKKKSKPGKKPREKIKLTPEQRLALPPTTKASEYGYDVCKNEHAAGQSADHFSCHCPAKSTSVLRAAVEKQGPASAAISESDIQRIASIVAETIRQDAYSLAGLSRCAIDHNYMMKASSLEWHRILLDGCASNNEACSPQFIRSVTDNSSRSLIKTANGPYSNAQNCIMPFVGTAGVNPTGESNIWSQGCARSNPNFRLKCNEDSTATFLVIPLDVTLVFDTLSAMSSTLTAETLSLPAMSTKLTVTS